jgi:2-keto-3-deoxy-L-rhamnonate aldolase RhmA
MVLKNSFRDKLKAGKATVGTHFMLVDPDVAEIIGDTGLFDYGEFTAEYSAFDMPMLYHLARSAQCGNLPLMIKPDQESQGFVTQAALGAGFKAVLFTDIRQPEDIDVCHRQLRPDTPTEGGHMGVKLRRPALTSYDTGAYLEDLSSIVFCIMLEKNIAVENIDAVLSRAKEKGVDMTQWGPADFSFSRGEPGLQASPKIRTFEELVIKKSLEYGIRPRIEIGSSEQAKRYIDLGVKDFCAGWDRFILRAQFAQLGEAMKKLTEPL